MYETIWKETLNLLSLEVSYQEYNTWMSQLHYVSSDEKSITLAVPSKLVKDIVTERYLKPINEKLKGLVGKNVKLTITINPSLTPTVGASGL